MKKLKKSILFFCSTREEAHEELIQNPNWNEKFSKFFQADYDEILSTFSIPVLVIILSILLSYSAHGQETGRLNDYFETGENSEESYSVPPRVNQNVHQNQEEANFPDEEEVQVQKSSSRRSVQPSVRTYQLPSGGMVNEYRGEGGMLIRENHWSDYTSDPVMRMSEPIPHRSTVRSRRTVRERSEQEQAIQEEEFLDQEIREQEIREQAIRNQEIREQAIREQVIRDHEIREQAIQEQEIREQAIQDQEIRDQQIRERMRREQAIHEQEIREQAIREEIAREQAIHEEALREEAARQQAIRDQEIREEVAREFAERAEQMESREPVLMPASIDLNDEPLEEVKNSTPKTPDEEIPTEPAKEMQAATSANQNRELKTWDQVGLIPQNWAEPQEERGNEGSLAQNLPDSLPDSLPENLSGENAVSVSAEGLAEAKPEVPEVPMVEIQPQTVEPFNVVSPSEVVNFLNEVNTEIYNQEFDSAVCAMQKSSEPIHSFVMEPISKSDVENGWVETSEEGIQQVSNSEPLLDDKTSLESLGKVTLSTSGQGIKRLTAPRKGNRENAASSSKRFPIDVSEEALEEMISVGEKAAGVSDSGNKIEFENQEMVSAAEEMRHAAVLPDVKATKKSAAISDETSKKSLNLFNFGIDDMQVFDEKETTSAQNTEETKSNVGEKKPVPSESMSCIEEENENGEVISVSEATSTISTIYYESCKNRSNVQLVSYEENGGNERKPMNGNSSSEKNAQAQTDESNEPLDLDILLLPPDEFEAKSINEIQEEADALQNTESSHTDFVTGKNISTIDEALHEDLLPAVPGEPIPSKNSASVQDSTSTDGLVSTEDSVSVQDSTSTDGLVSTEDSASVQDSTSTDGLVSTEDSVSAEDSPALPPVPAMSGDEEAGEINILEMESDENEVLSTKEKGKSEAQKQDLASDSLEVNPDGDDFLSDSDGELELKSELKQKAKANLVPEPMVDQVAEQVSSQIAEQIADRIAERVVERTVAEVMKRMKAQMESEMAQKMNFEETAISQTKKQFPVAVDSLPDDSKEYAESSGKVPGETLATNSNDSPVVAAPTKLVRPRHLNTPSTENLREVESLNSLSTDEVTEQKQVASEDFEPMIQELNAAIGMQAREPEFQHQNSISEKNEVQRSTDSKDSPGFVKLSGRRKNKQLVEGPKGSTLAQAESIPNSPRLASDDSRLTPENPRLAPDDSRLAAENPRLTSDDSRLALDDSRLAAENPRLAAKNPRLAAENPRLTSDDPRPALDDPRLTSDDSRPTPENSRSEAGFTRPEAEIPQEAENPQSDLITERPIQVVQLPGSVQRENISSAEGVDPWHSASAQNTQTTEKQTFRATMKNSPAKNLTLYSCQGIVLNVSSQVQQISIENTQFCDSIELGRNQIAVIGKSAGETLVKIEFQDKNIKPMIFNVTVQVNDPNAQILADWGHGMESRLNQSLGNGNLSVFLFQNRIFVKGKLDARFQPEDLMNTVQNDFVRLKKTHPDLKIPGITDRNRKMILVNMLMVN